MALLNYADKVVLNTNVGVADINKVKADDMNAIKNTLNNNVAFGWIPSGVDLTFSSVVGSIGTVSTSIDTRSFLEEGMKIKYDQTQAITSYWSFDANSNDAKSGYNGTDTNMVYSAGKFSNGAAFNGATSKIVISDTALLKPTSAFTIGCWFKTNNTGATKGLFQSFAYGALASAGIKLSISIANKMQAETGENSTANLTLNGTTVVTDNAWHYAVMTYQNNYLQVYLDGKIEISGYALPPAYKATNYVRIGCTCDAGSDTNFMNGMIDDMFFINGYALGEKVIRDKYNLGTAQGLSDITITKTAFINNNPLDSSLTLYHGTDSALMNSAITNIYYSSAKKPFGFNVNKDKWSIISQYNIASTQSSPVNGTYYNLGSRQIAVPTGKWEIGFITDIYASRTSGRIDLVACLSTTNNSCSDTTLKLRDGKDAVTLNITTLSRNKNIFLNALTTFYLNYMAEVAGITVIGSDGSAGSPVIIKAISNYL